jgi:hypothetical protein
LKELHKQWVYNSISDAIKQRISELNTTVKGIHLSNQTNSMTPTNPRTGTSHNVLYHVRKQDVEIDGDNTMLIEEIQSDWHQEGRKKGYRTKEIQEAQIKSKLDEL